ncbi:hypothetical protein [Desulforhabdus amnigena]|uniref:Uncharacterized protein n=1 Tax=Desulforhabdus amnigena TaxID=40218 RepID=A0A9W6FUZ9_9BACT|nr:hypothetical protein [Desulforhabdus amnigena]NLJ28819.1 hypothetical protein [Deltaproteobacteria bacterium]GLI35362.1 hypothetical protein DAMNIGENAA_27950 [Desulforhabdus amnigena]
MELGSIIPMASEKGCDCCETGDAERDKNGEPFGCAQRKMIFTRREEEVLRRIREAREEAKSVKAKIDYIAEHESSNMEAWKKANKKLEELRRLRWELEKERIEAAHERMVLLGHA